MKVPPQYEPEEGPLTDAQLRQIRKQVAHGKSEDAKRTGVYHPAAGVHRELHQLAETPYSFRKAGKSPTRRELIIPFGATGYVALDEIASPSSVVVLAVRHQREEDYH